MRDGVLNMKLCAVIVGYVLRKWSVDCSLDHSLCGLEYCFWLKDDFVLYGVKNALFVLGYCVLEKSTKDN